MTIICSIAHKKTKSSYAYVAYIYNILHSNPIRFLLSCGHHSLNQFLKNSLEKHLGTVTAIFLQTVSRGHTACPSWRTTNTVKPWSKILTPTIWTKERHLSRCCANCMLVWQPWWRENFPSCDRPRAALPEVLCTAESGSRPTSSLCELCWSHEPCST